MDTTLLYRQLMDQLSQWVTPKDVRHLQRVSEVVGTILQSQEVCPTLWLPHLSHRDCSARAHLERIHYLLENPQLCAERFYSPLLQKVLSAFARDAWERLFRRYLVESASVEPLITLRVTENWLEYTLRYVVDYKQRRAKASQLFQYVMDEIDRSEGKVAIAARPIHLVQTPPLDVHVVNEAMPRTPSGP
jgi:hypothetical protein